MTYRKLHYQSEILVEHIETALVVITGLNFRYILIVSLLKGFYIVWMHFRDFCMKSPLNQINTKINIIYLNLLFEATLHNQSKEAD